MFKRGREAHSDVREGSGGPHGGLGGPPVGTGEVGRPTRRSEKGWEAHLEVREGSGG